MGPTVNPSRRAALILVLPSLFLAGCLAPMEITRARTLERGTWEWGAAVGLGAWDEGRRVPQEHPTGGMRVLLPIPPAELWASYGLAPRLEVDARLGLTAAQAGFKAGLVRSDRLDLALRASASVEATEAPDGGASRVRAALVAGIPLGSRVELDVAPQASWRTGHLTGEPELLGATGAIHYGPLRSGGRRIGLAVSVLRYLATDPHPGDVANGTYVGAAVVLSLGGNAADR